MTSAPSTSSATTSEERSQFSLLAQRRFAPFFWTQFLGAGNDNVFKFAFTILVTYQAAKFGGINPDQAAFLIGAIFIAPFVLFSATAGQLADKYEKSRLIRFVKNLEIGIMIVAALGFIFYSATILYIATFMMGLHSTLFGPVKYSYLPAHLREDELVGGNGLVEMGTFVSILLGTMLGGALAAAEGGAWYVAIACIVVAVAGRVAAGYIPDSPAAVPKLKINWNPITETHQNLKIGYGNRTVWLSMLGISWLWFFGATFLTSFAPFAKKVIGGDPSVVTLLLAVFSVGIGVGSLLCERLSGHKVEIGLVPFGSIGMTVFAADLFFASHNLLPQTTLMGVGGFIANPVHWRILADLFLVAMFGGFYSVPLYALIQTRCEPDYRARIIAANNILNALFMIVSALLAATLLSKGFTIPQLFLVTAVLNAFVAIYIYTLVPEFLMRFLAWILCNTIYRIKTIDIDRIPDKGAAVLVCNHVSFVDAVVIMGSSPRPIRFVMDHAIFKIPVLSYFFRHAKAIAIAPMKENPELLQKANDRIAKALEEGDLVCIFPEGRITDTGEIYPFKKGIQKIVERTPVPVIPMALRGLWGSFFSRKDGKAMTRPMRRGIFSRLELVVGEPVAPADVSPEKLQDSVYALRGDWK